jgi:hypothetical protein
MSWRVNLSNTFPHGDHTNGPKCGLGFGALQVQGQVLPSVSPTWPFSVAYLLAYGLMQSARQLGQSRMIVAPLWSLYGLSLQDTEKREIVGA